MLPEHQQCSGQGKSIDPGEKNRLHLTKSPRTTILMMKNLDNLISWFDNKDIKSNKNFVRNHNDPLNLEDDQYARPSQSP